MNALLLGGLAISGILLVLWLISVAKHDVSIIDAFWGAGFGLLSWIYVTAADEVSMRSIIVAVLVTIWGVRLSLHILWRSRGASEDYRYAAMRRRWGQSFWWTSLGIVFGLQGVLMIIISFPIYTATLAPYGSLGAMDCLGLALFAIGLAFEIIGDRQLGQFKADAANRGRTLRTGLWRYTRHPNYFGDALLWWGIYFIGGVGGGAAWTVFSPALMTLLLLRVSGVPLLEAHMRSTRPDFADYADRTNSFLPWLPRPSRPPCDQISG